MLFKKINAVVALLIIVSLAGHAGTMTVSLFTGWYDLAICKNFAYATVILVMIHAFMSICSVFFLHDGTRISYKKENIRLILQRATALVILVLIHVHTNAYQHMATGEVLSGTQSLLFCLSEVVYIAAVMTHTAVSFSKAFLTLGWVSSGTTVKRMDKILYIVCGVAGAVAIAAVVSFFAGV